MLDIESISDNLCTQGFHIIDDFLEQEHYQALCTIAQEMNEKNLFKGARIGLQTNAQRNNEIRTDTIYWIDETSNHTAIKAYLNKLHSLARGLNQSLFLSICEFETHFAAYNPGDFYKKHVDQFATTKNRKISCVFYLNQSWMESSGGELKLYNEEVQLIHAVSPKGNRFICFNSELPHEVCLTHKTRYSITGWMKTRSTSLAL